MSLFLWALPLLLGFSRNFTATFFYNVYVQYLQMYHYLFIYLKTYIYVNIFQQNKHKLDYESGQRYINVYRHTLTEIVLSPVFFM